LSARSIQLSFLQGENNGYRQEHIVEIIKRSLMTAYDDIVRELAFDLMVQRGLKDSDQRRANDVLTNAID